MRKEQRFCEICNLTVYSDTVWQIHLSGQKHQKKQWDIEQRGFCELCNVTVQDYDTLQSHLRGNKHQRKQRKKELTFRNSSLVSNNN